MNRPAERYKPDNGGLYPIKVNGKYGFMDRSGKTVITPQFDGAGGFSEGLADVMVGAKWGYINTNGSVVITPQFTGNGPFRYGRALVVLGNRFGFVDKDGKYICNPDLLWAGSFSGDLAPVKTADGALAFMNRSGKIVPSGKIETLAGGGFTAGLAPAATAGKWGFIDAAGQWVINPQFESAGNFADGLAFVVVGGRTGYIDQKGKFVVNPQYDTGSFDGGFYDGYAVFSSGSKFGFIDTKGRVVVEPKFLAASRFSDGLAPVKTVDGWGFIDRTGKMTITPQFDNAEAFQGGLAKVVVGGKEAYVTKAGSFVVDPFPVVASDLSHIDPAYRPMVQDWLQQHRRFGALAVMSDCQDCREGGLFEGFGKKEKDPYWDNKHPYYAVGDFNKDGQPDLAVVSKHGDLVIFNGPLRVGATGQFVGNLLCGKGTGLGQCDATGSPGYLYYKADKNNFICGSYGTEVTCSVRASGNGYVFHP